MAPTLHRRPLSSRAGRGTLWFCPPSVGAWLGSPRGLRHGKGKGLTGGWQEAWWAEAVLWVSL